MFKNAKNSCLFLVLLVTCLHYYILYRFLERKIRKPSDNKFSSQRISRVTLKILRILPIPHYYLKTSMKINKHNYMIYVHRFHDHFSKELLGGKVPGIRKIREMLIYFRQNPNHQFLDINCYLGVYTLVLAAINVHVVAVDPFDENIFRLSQSLLMNGIKNNVKLLINGISDSRENISLGAVSNNFTNLIIKQNVKRVQTITIDDLIPLLNVSLKLVLKLDIFDDDAKSLLGAEKLFSVFDISAIQTKWVKTPTESTVLSIMNFFTVRNYYPYISLHTNMKLSLERYWRWGSTVIWKRL